jgi:very-short-patch-repair endonuclease
MPRRVDKIHNEKRLKAIRRALRNETTSAEAELWKYLQKSQLKGRKFRRQHSIGPYVVDFYCPVEKLAVELDGEPHNAPNRRDYDSEREAYLQAQGVRVVRFENRVVFENIDVVLEGIAWHFDG